MTQSTMQAVALRGFGGTDQLAILKTPVPDVGAGQVLIEVRAAGVGPWDCFLRRGDWPSMVDRFPFIMGGESAGVVVQVGAGVTRFKEGDRVYGYPRQGGADAEYLVAPADRIAFMPGGLRFEEAAALPISALTAHQGLEEAGVKAGETVLVTAAAGGTGAFAVQIAVALGARVIGTARTVNHDFLRRLGAETVIDYTQTDFTEAIRAAYPAGVDAVLDNVGGDTLLRCERVLKDGGRLAYAASPSASVRLSPSREIKAQFVAVHSGNAERLAAITDLVEQGRLVVHLDSVFPLGDVPKAHERIETSHVRGKVVLSLSSAKQANFLE